MRHIPLAIVLIAVAPTGAIAAPSSLTAAIAAQQPTEEQHREAVKHFRVGMEALAAERYDEAEAAFRSAVRLDPRYDAAFYGLGQVYMATKRYEQALQAYLDSREAFKSAVAQEALDGVAADRRLRDQIQALRDYGRSLERATRTLSPNLGRAVERNSEQIAQLEGRLSRNRHGSTPPVPAGLSMALGSAYFRLNRLPEAEREYKAAVDVNPNFGEAHSNLAVVYLLTGRYDEAEKAIQSAEHAGFKVNPKLKEDVRKKKSDARGPSGGADRHDPR